LNFDILTKFLLLSLLQQIASIDSSSTSTSSASESVKLAQLQKKCDELQKKVDSATGSSLPTGIYLLL
jgi:hypothetical protein